MVLVIQQKNMRQARQEHGHDQETSLQATCAKKIVGYLEGFLEEELPRASSSSPSSSSSSSSTRLLLLLLLLELNNEALSLSHEGLPLTLASCSLLLP